MKSIKIILLSLITLFYFGTSSAATISSTTAGGEWSSASTWNGGVVPGVNDDVIINGTVYVYNHSCNNITINTGGGIYNRVGYGVALYARGNIVNNGVVKKASSGDLYVHVYANLSNAGTFNPTITYFKPGNNHYISQNGNVIYEGEYRTEDTSSALVLGSYVEFKKAKLNGLFINTAPYFTKIITNGYNVFFNECTVDNFRIESDDTLNFNKSLLTLVHFYNHIKTDGEFYLYNSVYISGDWTNLGTVYNRNGYGVTTSFSKKLTNYGTISTHPGGGNLYVNCYRDIENNGTYKPYQTTLKAGSVHELSQANGSYFEGRWNAEDTISGIKLGSNVTFKSATLTGMAYWYNNPFFTKISTNGHKLTFAKCDISNFRIEGSDTLDLDSSLLTAIHFLNHPKTIGTFEIYNTIRFFDEWSHYGTLYNRNGYGITFYVLGKLNNYGTIATHPSGGNLYVDLSNDFYNAGVYNPYQTQVLQGINAQFSQKEDVYFNGRIYLQDTLSAITATSNLHFKKVYIGGQYSFTSTGFRSVINANGNTIHFDSCDLNTLLFEGDDTLNLNGSLLSSIRLDGDAKLKGTFSLYDYVSFNGKVENLGTLQNRSGYGVTTYITNAFTNKGNLINHPNGGSLYISLYNDLINEGIYKPYYTSVKHGINARLSQTENVQFEGTFYLDDTLSTITANSDLHFKKNSISGVYNNRTAERSVINSNGNSIHFDSCNLSTLMFLGNDSLNLNGSLVSSVRFDGNSKISGIYSLYDYVSFNGEIENLGTLQNRSGYGVSATITNTFTNNGSIINHPNGGVLYLNVSSSKFHNAGVLKPYTFELNGEKNHILTQESDKPFESQHHYISKKLDTLTLGSNLAFINGELRGYNDWGNVKTNGFTLEVNNTSMYWIYIFGNDTVRLANTELSSARFHNSPIIDGYFKLYNSVTFAENFNNNAVVENRGGYGVSMSVLGDLTNEGTIQNSSGGGYLSLETHGDVYNNGIFNIYTVGLNGKADRTVGGANAKGTLATFILKDTMTLVGENQMPYLSMNNGSYLTIAKDASLVCDGFNYNKMSEITNNGRISTTLTGFNYYQTFNYYNAKAEFKKDTPILGLQIEHYGNQQHPSATNSVNAWWRLKPTPSVVKDSIKKLRLYYLDGELGGKDENDLRVYFSPNAGLNWSRIEKDVSIDGSKNEISILNAPPYGHYLVSDNDLGILSFNPVIQRAEPKVFGNKGQVTVYGFGIGLNDSMNVYLKKAGSSNIVADTVYLTDAFGESFIATFNVDLADIGKYSMVLELDGQADLELTDYFTIENAERPQPWVVLGGRNKFLINRWQTFTINYGNKANTDAIGVPLFFVVNHIEGMEVDFPDFQIGIPKSFIDDGWTQWKDTAIDLYFTSDELAGFEGKNMRVYAFYVPTISAMSSESVRVKIKVPSVANLDMTVWITDPMYEGIPNKQKAGTPPEVSACIAAAAAKYTWDKAIGLIPGYDCYKLAYKVTETGVGEVLKDPNEPEKPSTWFSWGVSAWGWAWSVADCAGDLIPVAKGVKIGKELLDIAFDMKGNYDATQDCWDKFKAKQKGKFDSKGVYSFDPNEIAGPSGYGPDGYIEANADMVYTIYFENKDSATAAAQEVVVLDTLDKTKFDFSTLSFQDITIADSTYYIQSFAKEFRIIIDLAPRIQTLVQVTGGLDTVSGELKVSYVSLDRSTMELQEDVDLGFLPPNKTKPQGEGNFSYAIALKPNLSHDAEITNKALIFFDGNKPIATNVHKNTIDKIAPSSMVNGLAAETTDSNFVVSWGGNDPGCGIQNYTVMVSVNDSDFVVWKSNTAHTSDTFFGRNKTRYAFYSIATDSLGLTEGVSDESDASTYVKVNTGAVSSLDKEQITIAANAAANILNISLTEPGNVIVYDINGKQLLQSKLNAGSNTLPIAHLTPQSYVVVVQTKSTKVNKKIIVLPK